MVSENKSKNHFSQAKDTILSFQIYINFENPANECERLSYPNENPGAKH